MIQFKTEKGCFPFDMFALKCFFIRRSRFEVNVAIKRVLVIIFYIFYCLGFFTYCMRSNFYVWHIISRVKFPVS